MVAKLDEAKEFVRNYRKTHKNMKQREIDNLANSRHSPLLFLKGTWVNNSCDKDPKFFQLYNDVHTTTLF